MGEKDGKKDEKTDGSIVLKLDMHCEGCMTKIRKTARSIPGVDAARADWEANKLTVKASMDPSKLREELEKRTKKKVELISPQPPKKDKESNNNAQKKPDEKKADEKKSDEKKSKETTAVLKLQLHCTGCVDKIYKIASRFKGVDKVSIDKEKDLVTVNGTMDAKALVESLSEKMKRAVEIVPPKKEKENGEGGNGGGGGKKKGGGGGDGAVEVIGGNRLEYMGFPGYPPAPAPVPVPVYGPGYGYPYAPQPPYGYPFFSNPHPPQVFSDENPNACAIM